MKKLNVTLCVYRKVPKGNLAY